MPQSHKVQGRNGLNSFPLQYAQQVTKYWVSLVCKDTAAQFSPLAFEWSGAGADGEGWTENHISENGMSTWHVLHFQYLGSPGPGNPVVTLLIVGCILDEGKEVRYTVLPPQRQ